MSEKELPQENQAASPIGEIAHGPSGFDAFLDANQKKLMVIGTLLVLGIVAYVIITGIQQTAREEASAEISAASDLPTLNEAYEKHKSTPAGAVALDKIAKIQWQDQLQDKAIATLQTIVSEYPNHPLIGSIQMTLGDYHRELEQLDKAKTSYQAALASDSAVSSAALVALGDLALRESANEDANSSYDDVVTKFGQRHSDFKQIAQNRQKLVGTISPSETAPAPKENKHLQGMPEPPTAPTPDLDPLPPLEPATPTPAPSEE